MGGLLIEFSCLAHSLWLLHPRSSPAMASLMLPLTRSTTYDSHAFSLGDDSSSSVSKFPHTRAQLSAIARQYRPIDHYGSDPDGDDDFSRVSSSFVNTVVALLVDEKEDELKTLLKRTYGMDNDMV